ncbi:unnamed protein product [Protopolystoma xenopodis]|uniref:Uncharacterized protein n=1 Tax=Protopolystoma xenopodis TaxID=117903 RepID=A0A448XGH0_9PLAT|nr:unnamed protein product [Protopolystoma xenopodis]
MVTCHFTVSVTATTNGHGRLRSSNVSLAYSRPNWRAPEGQTARQQDNRQSSRPVCEISHFVNHSPLFSPTRAGGLSLSPVIASRCNALEGNWVFWTLDDVWQFRVGLYHRPPAPLSFLAFCFSLSPRLSGYSSYYHPRLDRQLLGQRIWLSLIFHA